MHNCTLYTKPSVYKHIQIAFTGNSAKQPTNNIVIDFIQIGIQISWCILKFLQISFLRSDALVAQQRVGTKYFKWSSAWSLPAEFLSGKLVLQMRKSCWHFRSCFFETPESHRVCRNKDHIPASPDYYYYTPGRLVLRNIFHKLPDN